MAGSSSHVAVVAFPFSSHAGSLFSLVRAMASFAPDTHFSFLSTKPSFAPIYHQAKPHPNISLVAISDGITGHHQPPTSHFEEIELFLGSFKESLREGLRTAQLAQNRELGCIVSDAFVWLTGDVAEEMAVKWVPVRTGSPHDLYVRLLVDFVRGIVGVGDEAPKIDEDELLSFLPCLSNHRVKDLPEGIFGDPNFIYNKICDRMACRLAESDTLVMNTIDGLDSCLDSYFQQNFRNYFAVGPFQLISSSRSAPPVDTYGCLSWLDGHKPGTVAYVSLGTLAILPPCELSSLAAGLEASGVPFLWSLKDEMQSSLPLGFIDRMTETGKGMIVPWTPQTSVLKHSSVGAFVSHCGWNSVLESIVSGVPLVCRPFFGDQKVNARLVSYVWKFGVALDEGSFTEKGVIRALDAIFKKDEGRKMVDKAIQLQDIVVAAVGENGSTVENMKRLLKFVC